MSGCKIDFLGLYKFFYALQTNRRLEVLIMNKNNFASEKIRELKQFLYVTNLKELRLSKCKLGNDGAAAIAEGLANNNSIKKIELSDNKIDDKGFLHFSDLPLKNFNIEYFDISKNNITVYKIFMYRIYQVETSQGILKKIKT